MIPPAKREQGYAGDGGLEPSKATRPTFPGLPHRQTAACRRHWALPVCCPAPKSPSACVSGLRAVEGEEVRHMFHIKRAAPSLLCFCFKRAPRLCRPGASRGVIGTGASRG